ncbi:MAG: hypothetical protein ACR2FJ_06750 [Qipengyuania sp.]
MRMRVSSRFNPAVGISDFWQAFRQPTPYRWPILGLSALSTFVLIFWITQERVVVPPQPPKVVYITTFAEGRTDAEIRASNIENQRRQERLRAEQAERNEQVRDMYRELGRATGIDVDAMERKIAEEQAREEAARVAQARAIRQRTENNSGD